MGTANLFKLYIRLYLGNKTLAKGCGISMEFYGNIICYIIK